MDGRTVLGHSSPTSYLQIEVDEPYERVLVHGLNVGQVRYTEEENGRVNGDRCVPIPRVVNLPLGDVGDLLLLGDLLRESLGGGEHHDGCLVLQDVPLQTNTSG